MQATMNAPRVGFPSHNAQAPGRPVPPAPAPQNQANKALEDVAQKAFAVIKKILDAEITAYRERSIAKEDQNGKGYTPVGIKNMVTGEAFYMCVDGKNILKYISQPRLKEMEQMDVVKRAAFESVVSSVLQKLGDFNVIKEHPFIIVSCENLQGRLADSKFVRSIVMQICKL